MQRVLTTFLLNAILLLSVLMPIQAQTVNPPQVFPQSEDIVGGRIALPQEGRHNVRLLLGQKQNFSLGGTLLHNPNGNPIWVLTAAHGVNGLEPQELTVEVARHDLNSVTEYRALHKVKAIFIVPSFQTPVWDDIALLQLETAVVENYAVEAIYLPDADPRPEDGMNWPKYSYEGQNTTIVGFGTTQTETIRASDVLKLATGTIGNIEPVPGINSYFYNLRLTFGGPCYGDSGSSYTITQTQSSGEEREIALSLQSTGNCKQWSMGPYIPMFVPWILETMEKNSVTPANPDTRGVNKLFIPFFSAQ